MNSSISQNTLKTGAIPLVMTIEHIRRDEDVLTHQITIETPTHDSLIVADIESDFYEWPRLKAYHVGLLELPDRLRDTFLFKVFDLLAAKMYDASGVRCRRSMSDCTRWIESHFLSDEARILLTALASKISPNADVQDAWCVDIDP